MSRDRSRLQSCVPYANPYFKENGAPLSVAPSSGSLSDTRLSRLAVASLEALESDAFFQDIADGRRVDWERIEKLC